MLRLLGWIGGVVLVLIVLLLLALQTNRGGRVAADVAIGILDPFDNAELSVGRFGGSWLRSLKLYEVDFVRDDTVRMAHVDTLHVHYRLLPLLRGRLHVREVLVSGLDVAMTQQPDASWDLLNAIKRDTTAVEDTVAVESGFVIQVDTIDVRRVQAHMAFYHPAKDSSLSVEALDTRVQGLTMGPGDALAVAVPRLHTRFLPPDTDAPVSLATTLRLEDDLLTLDTLSLDSERSHLTASGMVQLPGSEGEMVRPLLQWRAEPLALGDITPFVPVLNPQAVVTMNGELGSEDELYAVTLDAQLGDGATMTLAADLTPTLTGPLMYRVDGQIRRFDPNYLTAAPSETPVLVNTDLTVDLAGESLDALSGTVRATVFDTQFADYAPDRTTLDVRFMDGVAQLEGRTGLRGALVDLGGTIRPFDDTPTYDLRGQLQHLNIGRFLDDDTQSSDVTTAFRIVGTGFDPDSSDITATLELAPSQVNRMRLEEGLVEVQVRNGRVVFDADVCLPEGEVLAEGTVTLGEELRYQVNRGELRNVDGAALAGDTTRSQINATFALRGRGTDPATMRLEDVQLELQNTFYGPYRVHNATADATLANGRFDLQTNAVLEGGALNLTAMARPFDRTLTYSITNGRFENLHLGTLLQNPDLATDLTGRLTLTGSGTDPAQAELTTRLDLEPSTINDQAIDAGTVQLDLQQGILAYAAQLTTPTGTTRLAGDATDLFGEAPVLALNEGVFEGINLGAWLGDEALQSNLTGTLAANGQGFDPNTARWAMQLDLAPSQINDQTLPNGLLSLELEDGLARIGSDISLGEGHVQLRASGRFFDEVPTYEAEGTLDQLDLDRLTGIDTLDTRLSLGFTVNGSGLEPETMQLAATVQGQEAQVLGASLDRLYGAVNLSGGLLTVDTLDVKSSLADINGHGPIALFDTTSASDFEVVATLRDVQPLAPYVGARVFAIPDGVFTGRIYGRPGLLRFEGEAEFENIAYNVFHATETEVRLAGEFNRDLSIRFAEVVGDIGFTSTPTFSIEETVLEARYNGASVEYLTEITVDDSHTVQLNGQVDLRPESQRIVFENFGMRLGPDRWEMLQEASISYGDEYRVRNFLIYADDQQVALDGVVDLDGEQSLILTIEDLKMGTFAELLGIDGLDGSLYGTLDLTGPAASPNISGTLNMDVISYGQPVGDLQLVIGYDSLRFNIDAQLAHENGNTLRLNGYVPVDLRLSQPDEAEPTMQETVQISTPTSGDNTVDLRLSAEDFSIGWVQPFLDPEIVGSVAGILNADVTVGGTLNDPVLSGSARFENGRMRLPEINLTYERARADIEFAEDQVRVNHLEVWTSNRGSMIGEGTVDLPDLTLGEFHLNASLEDFRLINTDEYRMVSGGDLELSGTTERPVLTGDLQIISADIYLTEETTSEEFLPVALTDADLRILEQRFGIRVAEEDTTTFDFYVALTMDLNVELERDVWLRSESNPEMNIQFTGDLELRKQANQEEQMFGVIEVIPQRSYINQFGRRFNITSGTLTFNGPSTLPFLDVQAAYEVRSRGNQGEEITINLNLSGTPEDLDTELSSDPSTDLTNIISYIATGRPADEAFQLGGTGTLADRGAGLALGQVANVIENAAGSELGLDVIEIKQEGLRGATVTAGKYLTRQLYVSVSQPISFSGNSGQESAASNSTSTRVITIEYELFEWLLARAASDGSSIRALLLWEYAY